MATADELLSTCEIEIRGCAIAEHNYVFFTQVMTKLCRHMTKGNKITLMLSPREPGKMLEWGANIAYQGGGRMYIGIIQRKPGDEPEFHS